MKTLGKGLLVVLFGFGVVISLGLSNFFYESSNLKDLETSEENEEGSKKKKNNVIPATIDICPYKLNFKSKGKWISVYIELLNNYDVNDIVLEEILLNGVLYPEVSPYGIGDNDNDDILDLMVKFDRNNVKSIIEVVQYSGITITGKLVSGQKFEGSCIIELLHF